MVKSELGTKRICVSCGARFYDLGRQPAVCPKCDTEQPAEQLRLRRPTLPLSVEDRRPKKPAPPTNEAGIDLEEAPEPTEEDVIEDASDLGDDPDALGNDIEVGSGDEREG